METVMEQPPPKRQKQKGNQGIKVKRVKKKRNPQAPRRPMTSYMLFSQSKREQVKQELGSEAKSTNVMRRLAEMWANVSDEEKQKYVKLSDEDKIRYYREMEAFKSSGQGDVYLSSPSPSPSSSSSSYKKKASQVKQPSQDPHQRTMDQFVPHRPQEVPRQHQQAQGVPPMEEDEKEVVIEEEDTEDEEPN